MSIYSLDKNGSKYLTWKSKRPGDELLAARWLPTTEVQSINKFLLIIFKLLGY